MRAMIDKYLSKLSTQGLAARQDSLFVALDADFFSNRDDDPRLPVMKKVFGRMNINSLLYASPMEPYRSIITALAAKEPSHLTPSDCETRTFFHDIPVIAWFDAAAISDALSRRKAAVFPDGNIVSMGTVSPEQAFISLSSVCFSCFVKYFTDILWLMDSGAVPQPGLREEFSGIAANLPTEKTAPAPLSSSAPEEKAIDLAIAAAGRALVGQGLVDSYFGNISYVHRDSIHISETGSSLDELEGAIDTVPLDGSSSAGITASSELTAHRGIFEKTGLRAILHGHPKFTVIMSMSCRKKVCSISDCYRRCREPRRVLGIPVVSGEIGTGPTGLCHTVPDAMIEGRAAIVYGHGIFAAGPDGFFEPFHLVQEFESQCRQEYFSRVTPWLSSKK